MAPFSIAALIAFIVGVVVLVSSFRKNKVRIHYKESVIEQVESRWWGLSKKFDGKDTLIQCKHCRTWKVGEPVVRQMLGSMTDFGVQKGAIYSMKRWTQPAAEFAQKHSIQMVDGTQLAERALTRLSPASLDQILNNNTHHCPKCESPMVYRTGNFKPFWGCSTFPRCRGTIKTV